MYRMGKTSTMTKVDLFICNVYLLSWWAKIEDVFEMFKINI